MTQKIKQFWLKCSLLLNLKKPEIFKLEPPVAMMKYI